MNNFEILLIVNDLKKHELFDDFMKVIREVCDPIIKENDDLKKKAIWAETAHEYSVKTMDRLASELKVANKELERLRKLEDIGQVPRFVDPMN